ncbi:MAG: hypothetical protein WAU58_16825 [Terriglobales bacterium]
MPQSSLDHKLAELEAARYRFNPGDGAHVEKLLRAIDKTLFPEAASLIRFHESLMFLRAFPQSPAVLRATERILNHFHEKVATLRQSGTDMDAFDPLEVSGIAGTQMEDTLSFDVAHWLIHHMPGQVEIAWDNYEPGRELGTTGPRFMPLLEDDSFVEADTPFRRWLETASGLSAERGESGSGLKAGELLRDKRLRALAAKRRKSAAHGASRGYEAELIQPHRGERESLTHAPIAATARWLIDRFDRLPLPPLQKAELYESLRIPLRWNLANSRLTRTRNWHSVRKVYYHAGPLISRSQVSLADELAKRPPSFTKLSLKEGERIADMIREVMLVRYRELYGTTLADPRSVVRADLGKDKAGRGVEIYLWNLPPDRRLPLRAYVAGFTLKNGVPINYIEAIGVCEWMEVGFNTFYTFRGGEAGWIYAQVLRSLCAWMGTTVVSVYPYQLGQDNEEAIESGAFWFYRKLGFRPGRADLRKLVEREEEKITADPKYRTPARILKRLAAGHVFYELPGSEVGAWDTFSTRNIGLRVNRRMAREFGGDADRMRKHARRVLERTLDIRIGTVSTYSWTPLERAAFDNFALVLTQVPQLRAWTSKEKEDLVRIIRAKSKPDETLYLHLTQQHDKLREVLLRAGHSQ